MAAIGERRVELGGFETRALELAGSGAGPPLVLLHGFSDSADTWRPLMRRLGDAGRAAVAVDLPGFGTADRLARDRPILPQLDRFAAAAVAHAASGSAEGRVVVAGNSLGGCVALRAAQRSEAPIAGIVPIAPAGLDLARWISVIEGAWAVQAVMRSPVPMPELAIRGLVGRAYRTLASSAPAALDPDVVTSFTRHVRSKRDVVRILGTGRRLKPELRAPFELGWIRCPVLVVWGERDRMVSPAGAKRILAEVPQARLESIEACGHCPQVECPDVVAGLLDEWLDALPGTRAGCNSARS